MAGFLSPSCRRRLGVLESRLVRDGQLFATLCTTRSQHLTAVGSSHSLTETVLVDSLPARRLVSSFHCHSYLVLLFLRALRIAKVAHFSIFTKKTLFFLPSVNRVAHSFSVPTGGGLRSLRLRNPKEKDGAAFRNLFLLSRRLKRKVSSPSACDRRDPVRVSSHFKTL